MDLSHLNTPQRQAVTTLQGPVLVLAGAGSGKTTVITWRIVALLRQGVPAHQILAVTFTNKAAREMRERIAKLVSGNTAKELTISTFHSFGCQLLRRHIQLLGYTSKFGIADPSDQEGLVRQVVGELNLDGQYKPMEFVVGISQMKNNLQTPESMREHRLPYFRLLGQVYEGYQRHLSNMNLVDFDDLLLLVLRLWERHPEILKKHQERYQYLMVDEFQDTNMVQAEIIRHLAGSSRHVCVVGDDDQSIYGWRGASISNILDFPQAYPGTSVIRLEQNYRSTNTILKAANAIISRNERRHQKKLWSEKPLGDAILLVRCESDEEEARLLPRVLQQNKLDRQVPFEKMAVLFRSNHQTRLLEIHLREAGIPYRLVGANSYFERREVKDAAAYLRLLLNPRDDLALLRILNVPPRGLGDKVVDSLKAEHESSQRPMLDLLGSQALQARVGGTSAETLRALHYLFQTGAREFDEPGKLAKKIETFLTRTDYLTGIKRIYRNHDEALERHSNVLELISAAAEFEDKQDQLGRSANLQDFLESVSLLEDQDRTEKKEQDAAGVTLMTVHASKGLEFALVVVVGLEQGLFPHDRSLQERTVDEERRLFYVAVTRAQQWLVLSWARRRSKRAEKLVTHHSQFLDDLPRELVHEVTAKDALRPATQSETSDFIAQARARLAALRK